MAKKFNQSLLNEELKKFRLLSEYTFYNEEPKKQDDLILGAVDEADEEPAADATADAPVDDSKTAANADAGGAEGDDANNLFSTDDSGAEDAGADTGADDADAGNMGADDIDMGANDADAGNMGAEETPADSGDEVEVDVTQIVKGSEEAKKAADLSFLKTSELLSKFNDLEQRVAAMDSISSKIDTLEKEIVKRNPTPVEKLEMRSMSSFPYNIKLTDYWKDVDGYDTGVEEPKEFVLTKDDVDTGYTDASIKNTFNIPDDDFEEEDLNS
jgi:hypothetical protein